MIFEDVLLFGNWFYYYLVRGFTITVSNKLQLRESSFLLDPPILGKVKVLSSRTRGMDKKIVGTKFVVLHQFLD